MNDDPHRAARRTSIAIVGVALAAIGSVALIFLIGVRHVPDLPTLAEQPEPRLTGWIAVQRFDNNRSCIEVIDATTGAAMLPCIDAGSGAGDVPPSFDDTGNVLIGSYTSSGVRVITVDVHTGEKLSDEIVAAEKIVYPTRPDTRSDGTRVSSVYHDNGRVEIVIDPSDGAPRTLWTARGPDGYEIWGPYWSTQGDYVLANDSKGRVIVFAASGDPFPRVIAADAQASWFEPA